MTVPCQWRSSVSPCTWWFFAAMMLTCPTTCPSPSCPTPHSVVGVCHPEASSQVVGVLQKTQTTLLVRFGRILYVYETFRRKKGNVSRHVLGFVCFAVQNMPSSGFSVAHVLSLTTSRCHSASFCIVLCVVLVLNSWAVQSEACIFTAKYERLPFFWKPC